MQTRMMSLQLFSSLLSLFKRIPAELPRETRRGHAQLVSGGGHPALGRSRLPLKAGPTPPCLFLSLPPSGPPPRSPGSSPPLPLPPQPPPHTLPPSLPPLGHAPRRGSSRSVLEIRNSRSHKNACSLCCAESFQEKIGVSHAPRRGSSRNGPPPSPSPPSAGPLLHDGRPRE